MYEDMCEQRNKWETVATRLVGGNEQVPRDATGYKERHFRLAPVMRLPVAKKNPTSNAPRRSGSSFSASRKPERSAVKLGGPSAAEDHPMGTHKNRRAREAYAAVGLLVETFPAAFVRINRRPLKLGIHDDLLARGIATDVVKAGLGSYCRSTGYLEAMKAGAARIDLDGNAAGVVTPDDAEHAARKRAEAAEKHQAKIAQDKAAKEQAKAAEKKKAADKEKAKPTPPVKPPVGPTVTRRPPLIVRKIGSRARR